MKTHFGSFLKADLEAFLAYKRALGFRYQRPEGTLCNFDRYVHRTCPAATGHQDPRGNAPRSSAYRAGALLLSYGTSDLFGSDLVNRGPERGGQNTS